MIPSKPDPDNTGEGKRPPPLFARRSTSLLAFYFFIYCVVMPEVFINQRSFPFAEDGRLADVLSMLSIGQADGIAIAVNETVIPRGEWQEYRLREGDRVFVIRATQGG
jgi:sulfur carrier protein